MSRDTFELVVLGTSCALALMCLFSMADSANRIAKAAKHVSLSASAIEHMQFQPGEGARRGKCCGRACGC